MTTLYSKFQPGVWAEALAPADSFGRIPAVVHGDGTQGVDSFSALLVESEWSTVELVPTPDEVPAEVYVVMGGDPALPEYTVTETEREAKKVDGAWGYAPVLVPRVMLPI